jgi:hypothetical protein
VRAQGVVGDAVEPRSSVRPREVEGSSGAERTQPYLAQELVGVPMARPASEVAVNRVAMSSDEGREHLGFTRQRGGDDLAIGVFHAFPSRESPLSPH